MLDRKGLGSRDRWPEMMDVVDWGTSLAVEGHEHLVEDEASQDALKGKYEEQHLVESDQDGYTRPSMMLTLSKPLNKRITYPAIVILVKKSDQLPGSKAQLVIH